MQDTTENSAEIIDPESILSSLAFSSASDQASYQCLLSATTEAAIGDGMQAYPVRWEDDPTRVRGSFQTWCVVPGSGAQAETDRASCASRSAASLQSPGARAITVFTRHLSSDNAVNTIGYSYKKIPEAGTPGWSISYRKSTSANFPGENMLLIRFAQFDGTQMTGLEGQIQHPYIYSDTDIGLVESVSTDRSVNQYLADYQDTSVQFKASVDEYLAAILPTIEEAIRSRSGLSEADRASALERANTEISQTRAFFEQYGDELHPLIRDQATHVECEAQ